LYRLFHVWHHSDTLTLFLQIFYCNESQMFEYLCKVLHLHLILVVYNKIIFIYILKCKQIDQITVPG